MLFHHDYIYTKNMIAGSSPVQCKYPEVDRLGLGLSLRTYSYRWRQSSWPGKRNMLKTHAECLISDSSDHRVQCQTDMSSK